ncbi:hypothetical protein BDV25DRAFT_147939 [Aspergillus avenaceus]|uniref:Uncharacterized protein n=1 Tax=Aspergillus avenaceus TaxID=36643 RepID=A0A5N6U6W2_ASPAV|nr:hypothetical protein BDV25DRAFT_147939 [Aspergillus avenaceus]
MGTRGLWNLRVNGRWYRSYHSRMRITPPDNEYTLERVRKLLDKIETIDSWEAIPFPSPIHFTIDYVLTVNCDEGTFTVSLRRTVNDVSTPMEIRLNTDSLRTATAETVRHMLSSPQHIQDRIPTPIVDIQAQQSITGILELRFGSPTGLNEIQERMFTDLVFTWRFHIDYPLTWSYNCAAFRVLTMAFLRIAAWDLEVTSNDAPDLPIGYTSIPSWSSPVMNVFWFHGYLVVLQADIKPDAMRCRAIEKAKAYLGKPMISSRNLSLILMSPYHVAFAQLSQDSVLCTDSLTLVANPSAIRCSPGFRALSRVLTHQSWTKPNLCRESWQFGLPVELLQMIFRASHPRDTVALAQSSFSTQRHYYNMVPQFGDLTVQTFKSSIPCCGQRVSLGPNDVSCSSCYAWQHLKCAGLTSHPGDGYICSNCQEGGANSGHIPGWIHATSRRHEREGIPVLINGSVKTLKQRTSKPLHQRREIGITPQATPRQSDQVDYTLVFNGIFTGLAYGLDNRS